METEAPVAPQQDAVGDAPQHVLHRLLEIGGRDRAGRDQHLSHALAGPVLLARERLLQRLGLQHAAVHENLAGLDRRRAGASEHRAAALEVDLGTLAAALELEAPVGLRELKELQDLAREEVLEVAFERRAQLTSRTSPTTRPSASTGPVMIGRLYQPSATTWPTVAVNSTPSAISVSGARRSVRMPGATVSSTSSETSADMSTPVSRPNSVGRMRTGPMKM